MFYTRRYSVNKFKPGDIVEWKYQSPISAYQYDFICGITNGNYQIQTYWGHGTRGIEEGSFLGIEKIHTLYTDIMREDD